MSGFITPRPIKADDDLAQFSCGTGTLDHWLKNRAKPNEISRASRTFVTTPVDQPQRVVGYFALAAGSVELRQASGRVRRNMPSPIPVVVLARLAVDTSWQRRGLGISLLQDSIIRSVAAGRQIGLRAMLVHAVDETAAAFYDRLGFTAAPPGGLTYMATIDDLARTLAASGDGTSQPSTS
ncbi:MAG: GNAT family N-acetyltransferase [Propionibacteriaceae bacterium]|jgi:predicted N-acetyltransferase YhbS|nr:GNAT family N-acetyltransferase [Propionibacteriaceae bacterium]